ncbi:hypothetical protein BDR06DRAFT_335701 [Suillus hirtellus]|nr:hypothetical protein BDR06DRAFT_335701 [Suillus hirtellus]
MSRGAPKPPPPHKLTFATNSVRNTTFAEDNNKFYYEIVTRFWHPHLTKINKYDYEARVVNCIAEIEDQPNKDVKVRFNTADAEGEWMRACDFLKNDGTMVGGTFTQEDGTEYRWKAPKRYLQLQLIKSNDEEEVPVAQYHPYKRHFGVWRMSQRAFLEVKPEAAAALDRIIVSYLLIERRKRQAKIKVKLETK